MSNENAKFKYSVFITEKVEKEYYVYCDEYLKEHQIEEEFEQVCYHNAERSLLIGEIDEKKVATSKITSDSTITEIEVSIKP